MALTLPLIQDASNHLSEAAKSLWVTLFRTSLIYKAYAVVYTLDLEARLGAAEGTVKAQQLNALMTLIGELGPGEVSIQGDRDSVYWSQSKERQALIDEAFSVLFDDISTLINFFPPGIDPSKGNFGDYATGQRPQLCGICGQNVSCYNYNVYRCGCIK